MVGWLDPLPAACPTKIEPAPYIRLGPTRPQFDLKAIPNGTVADGYVKPGGEVPLEEASKHLLKQNSDRWGDDR